MATQRARAKARQQTKPRDVEPLSSEKPNRKRKASPESVPQVVVEVAAVPAEAIAEKKTAKPKPKKVAAKPKAVADEKKSKDKKKDKKKDKEKKKKKKEAVVIRFERDQLARIDERAEALGLTRGAWVRMTVAQRLESDSTDPA